MFRSDPSLLYAAINSLSSAFESLKEADSMSSSLTSFPPDYPFSGEVNAILSDVKSAKTDVSSLSIKISETRDRLCKLDNNFALAYYQCAANSLNDFVGSLTVEQQMMKEMNQSKYETYLFNYLDDLNSKGLLPDDMVTIYQNLKEAKNYKQKIEKLQNAAKELKALKENAPTLPNVGGARLSERQMEEYKKKSKEYSDYLKKKLALEKNIEALQRETGNYVNKWYEDIGEAIAKTGSAWKTAWQTKSVNDALSAAKQTATTGVVVYKSAKSGVDKIGELVGDGLLAAGGSIVAGATWLFNHDAGKKLMDRTLDFVRRDLVGKSNNKFYENNTIGKWINENSNLKYDSAGAQAIQDAGEFVGKIALATAATVASGGTVAPIVIGALYGTGNAGEKYAQSVDRNNGESYNYAKALLKSTAGAVAGSAEFYGYGQMGASMLGVNISPQSSTSFVKNFLTKDTLLDSVSVVADHGVNVAFDDETWQHALLYGGAEFALALGMNAIGARQATKSAKAVETAGDVSDGIKQFAEFDISKVHPEVKNVSLNDLFESRLNESPWLKNEIDARIKDVSKYLKISKKGALQEINKRFQDVIDASVFGVRVTGDSLEKILDSGVLKNQFEVGNSRGIFDLSNRTDVEKKVLNIMENTSVGDRPVYGMLFPEIASKKTKNYYTAYNSPGFGYSDFAGGVIVLKKDKVIDNTTVTLGDSLMYKSQLVASKANDYQFHGAADAENLISSAFVDVPGNAPAKELGIEDLFPYHYCEIQVHGSDQHSINNIEEILFYNEPSENLKIKMQDKNISWRVISNISILK